MSTNRYNRRNFLARTSVMATAASLPPHLFWMRAAFAQSTAPKRLLIVYVGNGAHELAFFPNGPSSTSVPNYPSLLLPLQNHWADMQVVSGIHAYEPQSDVDFGGHGDQYKMLNARGSYRAMETVDSALSRALGGALGLVSLGTMMDSDTGRGLTLVRAGAAPQSHQRDPVRAFNAYFQGSSTVDTTAYDRQKRIIDIARTQVRRFRSQLGVLERAKLDGHEEALNRVDSLIRPPGPAENEFCDAPPFNAGGYSGNGSSTRDFSTVVSLHIELISLLLRCDMTRVITFNMCGDEGGKVIPDAGPTDADGHPLGEISYDYHGSVHGQLQNYNEYRLFFSRKLGELIDVLKRTPDVDGGRVFDNTLILFTSNMGNGSVHGNVRERTNIPTILAGGLNLGNRVGRYTNLGYDHSIFETIESTDGKVVTDAQRSAILGDTQTRPVQGRLLDTVAHMVGADVSAPNWPRYRGQLDLINELFV